MISTPTSTVKFEFVVEIKVHHFTSYPLTVLIENSTHSDFFNMLRVKKQFVMQ